MCDVSLGMWLLFALVVVCVSGVGLIGVLEMRNSTRMVVESMKEELVNQRNYTRDLIDLFYGTSKKAPDLAKPPKAPDDPKWDAVTLDPKEDSP